MLNTQERRVFTIIQNHEFVQPSKMK